MKEYEGRDGYEYRDDQPKWPIRRIVRWILCGISILVYLIIFIRLFGSRAPDFAEKILLDADAEAVYSSAEGLKARRIDLPTKKDDDGRVQVQYPVYLENADNYQFTLKMNSKYHDPDDYVFVLRKNISSSEEGEKTTEFYTDLYSDTAHRLGYDYIRLAFTGINFEKDDSLTLMALKKEYTGEYLPSEAEFSVTVYTNDAYTKYITSFEIISGYRGK